VRCQALTVARRAFDWIRALRMEYCHGAAARWRGLNDRCRYQGKALINLFKTIVVLGRLP
jgi:hypothetical protein